MPTVYIAGLPFDLATGALIRQVNQTPAPSDPYVRGIRVGPLGGVYMQDEQAEQVDIELPLEVPEVPPV